MKALTLAGVLLATFGGGGSTRAAELATADNVVITSGTTTIRIGHIEVAGSSLSNADLTSLFDTKDPKVLEARMRKLDAASIVIPEIAVETIEGSASDRFSQKQVRLTDVHGGRAETGSAAESLLAEKNDKLDTVISIASTTFKGLDLAQIVHLATGPRTDDAEPPRPLVDDIALQTVTIGGANKDGSPTVIASVRGTGLKGRTLRSNPGDAANDGKATLAAMNDIAHSFSAELIEADGLALDGTVGASTNGLKSLALKHVAVRGFGDGKLARFELIGLALEGNEKQPGRMALASAEIDHVASNASPVPSIDKIELHDFALDIPSDDKSAARIAVSVAHAAYQAPGLVIGKLPAKATLSIEHAAFDVPPDSGVAPMLLAMGYKHLDLSSESASRYDAAGQKLDIDRLSVAGAGMGALDLKLSLAKVSEAIVSQNDAAQKAAAAAILVKTLDVTLQDDGLIDKAIGFKAAIDSVTVAEERANLAQMLDLGMLTFGLQDSDKAQIIVAALQKFIAKPKTLHIALASRNGLGVASIPLIDSPRTLLDAVEVEASASE